MDTIQAVKTFKEYYQKTLGKALLDVTEERIEPYREMIGKVVHHTGGILYVFGNGGNYAIGRQFEITLRESVKSRRSAVVVRSGIDVYISERDAVHYGYENIFRQLLMREQACERDGVLLLSGSGNSTNVLRALEYCKAHTIPTLAFAGFDGGALYKQSRGRLWYVTGIHDQQVSEDIFQGVLYLVGRLIGAQRSAKGNFSAYKKTLLSALQSALDEVTSNRLLEVSNALVGAYMQDASVYVLAPEGGALSIAAEHVAHNLNWDVVFKVHKPPRRVIYSTPTHCDLSGIANDRLMPGIVYVQQLEKARSGDVLLLFVHDKTTEAVKNVYRFAKEHGVRVFVFGSLAGKSGAVRDGLMTTANVLQVIGHLLGRITHMQLKLALGEDKGVILTNQAEYLIKRYLAQRELIEERERL